MIDGLVGKDGIHYVGYIPEIIRKNEKRFSIKIRDASKFIIRPFRIRNKSPLDVKGIDLSLSADEIVDIIREIRER